MNTLQWALVIALSVSWFPQAVLVIVYILKLRSRQPELIEDHAAPEALVVLCLRGGDPFLSRCIAGLVCQDYPRYHVRFMVDHRDDPALPILQAELARHNFRQYEILFLDQPLDTCGLKCSSLAQAIESDWIYDESKLGIRTGNEFVALLDADTIPHPSWLRQLATALQRPSVGAATGNRWYIPDSPSMAALTRRAWNAAAIVQMYAYRIAWGGTLALKVSSIRRAQLLERWKLALCEDTMTQSQLNAIGQRLEFVPGLMMVNREDCNFAGMIPWMRRQLFTTRLYHPAWSAVAFHGISSAMLMLWGWGMVLTWLISGDWQLAATTAAVMIGFQVVLTSLLLPLSAAVNAIITARGEAIVAAVPAPWWNSVLSIIATQWVYTYALVTCMFLRRVNWRGIEYEARGTWQIKMMGYKPYQTTAGEAESL